MRSSYSWEKYFLLVSSNLILYCGSHFSVLFLSRPPKSKLQNNLCHPWMCEIQYTHTHIYLLPSQHAVEFGTHKTNPPNLDSFFAIFHFQFNSNYRASISIIRQLFKFVFTRALLVTLVFRFKISFSWLALASWIIGLRLSLFRYLSVPCMK